MLDTDNYHDYSTGERWQGNSSFEKVTRGISPHRAERWRTMLPESVIQLIEFMAGPDMVAAGFEPDDPFSI